MDYPIWNRVTSCIYKANKSYGVRETGEVEVLIGTGYQNSFSFIKHYVTHRKLEKDYRGFEQHEYRFYVDGKCIKCATVAGGMMREQSLNNMEG